MHKKLQIFISSTFTDLQEERQATVEAVLNAGHIPAGMELFKSGDESQKETIKRWIEESDVYMLILGGRYGTIEEESGKSYTHWEYDYAGELGKPRFAVVIKESYLNKKVSEIGKEVLEMKHPQEYEVFKNDVLSKTSKFFSDDKDIKLTVLESLKEFERDSSLSGWVSGKELGNQQELLSSNFKLLEENRKLEKEIDKLKSQITKDNQINGFSYEELITFLKTEEIEIPKEYFEDEELGGEVISLLEMFLAYEDNCAIGIQNQVGMKGDKKFFFFAVAPKLISLGLLEKVKVAGKTYQRIQTSKEGYKFLAMYHLSHNKAKA
jgi:hypothetical protein